MAGLFRDMERRKPMASETTARPQKPLRGDQRPAVSYLVRFWSEPREVGQEADLCRGYARDLRTGEELYFSDPRGLSEHIQRRLQAAREAEEAASDGETQDAVG